VVNLKKDLSNKNKNMKIIIIGGYGVFGGRLCQLLATDSRLSLFIAGRSLKDASAFCSSLPIEATRQALVFDRDKNLSEQLSAIRPDLVIDASGPFQSYGNEPYRLIKACIACEVNYMDFADGSDFVKGVSQFDQAAQERGIYVLSGVSSFPVLTAAVVRRLAHDLESVISIKAGIAPSPYAGVGMNVIRAIAAYSGQNIKLVRGGSPTLATALVENTRYTIAPPGRLPLRNIRFSLVDVPDLQVLPELWPELESIWVGAGTVPEVLHRMLNAMAWLVKLRILPSLRPFAPLFYYIMNAARWGEHRGGMFVEIEGTKTDRTKVSRSWHMLAEGNDGPFIPCMAIEAVIKRTLAGNKPASGARPASKDLELDDYEQLFSKRTILTGQREWINDSRSKLIFKTLLGSAWNDISEPLQKLHSADSEQVWSGKATVERGKGCLARLVAFVFQFPNENNCVDVAVKIKPTVSGEIWQRTFASQQFFSVLSLGEGLSDRLLNERFGPFSFGIALVSEDSKLKYVVRNWRFLGLPLPNVLAPKGNTYEFERDGKFCFHVEINHPVTGLIVKYIGTLTRQDS
jgi:Domain of unknown function (DUF4166)/Saccharopine dehydrogenase NADP binding domain